jgi:hypothetical protein
VTEPLRALPDLNGLLQEPERVNRIDPVDARNLIIQLSALLLALALRASEPPVAVVSNETSGAVWLSAEQVYTRFGLQASWLMEHRRQLSALGIVSRPSRKVRLYDAKRLGRFLESRRQSAATNSHVALDR